MILLNRGSYSPSQTGFESIVDLNLVRNLCRQLEKEIAYHLVVAIQMFRTGQVDENDIENAGETHFIIDMDNGKTLSISIRLCW